ncbi:hypothetical protein I79_022987 [Cricetulus griseus]|uniref:Uncharacterized protein n=1 Tax=Cricetulus griseus TaxID=10029 RepID=G3IGR2_CRIGR|nr:hypothetical protein I79_022987 [Cricetulus griseus]
MSISSRARIPCTLRSGISIGVKTFTGTQSPLNFICFFQPAVNGKKLALFGASLPCRGTPLQTVPQDDWNLFFGVASKIYSNSAFS